MLVRQYCGYEINLNLRTTIQVGTPKIRNHQYHNRFRYVSNVVEELSE